MERLVADMQTAADDLDASIEKAKGLIGAGRNFVAGFVDRHARGLERDGRKFSRLERTNERGADRHADMAEDHRLSGPMRGLHRLRANVLFGHASNFSNKSFNRGMRAIDARSLARRIRGD